MIALLSILKIVSATAWAFPAMLLVPGTFRFVRGRGRYWDAMWAVCTLGIVNRLMFTSGLFSRELSYTGAIVVAVALFFAVMSYQADHRYA